MTKLPYHKKTAELIERICKNIEREDFILDKKNAEKCILKTHDIFELKRPEKIVWYKDIFNKKLIDINNASKAWRDSNASCDSSAWNALCDSSAWRDSNALCASTAWNAWRASSVWNAWRDSSAWNALCASAVDYNFDWYIKTFEYSKNPNKNHPINDNDRKYLKYCELLMKAKEFGLGYCFEHDNTLYLVPTPIVKIDNQNRLHSEKKPSIRWKGGHKFYYLHGVAFEKEWWEKIVKDKMSPKEIFAIDNSEHRRIAYEYMEKTKMQRLKDFKILDEKMDDKGNKMKVISFKVKNINDPLKYYNCICPSTGREYFIGTNKNTCIEAKNALFGLEGDVEYVDEW